MKKISILIFLTISTIVLANSFVPLSWNNPKIYSQYDQFILEKNLNENSLISFKSTEDNFAISSKKLFLQSFKNFFSNSDNSSFYTKNIKDKKSLLNLRFYAGIDYKRNIELEEHYYYYNYAVLFTGNIRNKLFYYSNWYMGKFGLDKAYAKIHSPLVDTWIQNSTNEDGFYLDNMTAKIQYNSSIGDFAIGRGKYEIGNNIGGSVILNDAINDYGYFSHKLKLGEFELNFLHATLIADSTNANIDNNSLYYKTYGNKYLVVHKLDWNPNKKVHLFGGEHIIYGSRSIDPSYLLPHTFMRVTEHNLHNRDNVLIFLGGDYQVSQSNVLYSNLILDELSKSKIFTSWWANKYSFQIGDSQKLAFRDSKITAEFIAIRPWMYTHNILVNKFSHERRALGFEGGSNLLQYTVELNLDIFDNLNVDIQSSYKRQGSVGNDFSINYNDRPSDRASWLEGDITDTFKNGIIASWNINYHNKFKIGFEQIKLKNEKGKNSIFFSYQAIY